jgi:hypothetical protein
MIYPACKKGKHGSCPGIHAAVRCGCSCHDTIGIV